MFDHDAIYLFAQSLKNYDPWNSPSDETEKLVKHVGAQIREYAQQRGWDDIIKIVDRAVSDFEVLND